MLILLFTMVLGQNCDDLQQGTVDWWSCCFPYKTASTCESTATSYCDKEKNDIYHVFPVNEDCNNAGTCVDHTWNQPPGFTLGKCQCADPTSTNNFIWDEDENGVVHGDAWVFQIFTGNMCKDVEFQLYGTVSYLIKVDEWAPSDPTTRQGRAGVFECNIGSGPGIAFNEANPLEELGDDHAENWRTIPDMTPLVKAVIQFNEYWNGPNEALREHGYFNYKGIMVPWKDSQVNNQHCRVCSDEHPCYVGDMPDGGWLPEHEYGDTMSNGVAGGYLKVSFATNFNTFYNRTCEKTQGIMPTDIDGYSRDPLCPDNNDDGFAAANGFTTAIMGSDDGTHHKEHFLELTQAASDVIVFDYTHEDDGQLIVNGMNWDSKLQITRTNAGERLMKGTSTNTLRFPTVSPTMDPTTLPTPPPPSTMDTCFELGYTHQIADMKFMGIAQSGTRGCRWGLDEDWPGGDEPDMCDSPYVLCLPEANTPNAGYWTSEGTEYYPANDALYTIEMCKKECAYDQRCNGFEFWVTGEADGVSPTGEWILDNFYTGTCKLIDDIPVVATGPGGSSFGTAVTNEEDLWDWLPSQAANDGSFRTGVSAAICYIKDAECNPYFGEADLDAVMLNCYCPDNRKGFYTKNVHRTVEATKFCGADPNDAISMRIREAQANRMFHLCENWCLFNTQTPRTESWYHDPWMKCWREQYAGIGTHRSYCYRVIRDPFTIEQYFIDKRAEGMCPTSDADKGFTNGGNTQSPSMPPVTTVGWYIAAPEDSCDDRCATESLFCNNEDIMTVLNGNNSRIEAHMASAGHTCTEYAESDTISPNGSHGWATPAIGPNGECVTRHADANTPEMMAGCNVAIGVGYQRLCACGEVQLDLN